MTTSSVSGPAVAVPGRVSPPHRRTPRPLRPRTPGRPLRHDGGGLRGAGRGGGRRGVSDRRGAARGMRRGPGRRRGQRAGAPGRGQPRVGTGGPRGLGADGPGCRRHLSGLALVGVGRHRAGGERQREVRSARGRLGRERGGGRGADAVRAGDVRPLRGGRPRRGRAPLPLRPGRRGLQRRQAALRRRRRRPGVARDHDRRLQPLVGLRRDRGGARPGARLEPGNGRRRGERAPVRGRAARHPLPLGRDR